jgi:hypothetical protein
VRAPIRVTKVSRNGGGPDGHCLPDGPFDCAQGKLRPSLHRQLGFAFAGQPRRCRYVRRLCLRQLSRDWRLYYGADAVGELREISDQVRRFVDFEIDTEP